MAGPTVTLERRNSREQVSERVPPAPEREKRYIYNGDPPPRTAPYVMRQNRRATRRKHSTFNLVVMLLGFGLAIVVYVNNVIAINRLSASIGDLEKKLMDIQNKNEMLRSEVSRKSGRERIGTIAAGQLGLRYPSEPPVAIDVDGEKLQEVKEQ